jgi:hypothetical protein
MEHNEANKIRVIRGMLALGAIVKVDPQPGTPMYEDVQKLLKHAQQGSVPVCFEITDAGNYILLNEIKRRMVNEGIGIKEDIEARKQDIKDTLKCMLKEYNTDSRVELLIAMTLDEGEAAGIFKPDVKGNA